MKYETEHAAAFWSSNLHPSLAQSSVNTFEKELLRLLCEKFACHWYEEVPEKGQAYREISCDIDNHRIDEVLTKAAQIAGFVFSDYYLPNKGIRMWVDPGEVEVSYIVPPYRAQLIYVRPSYSSPPTTPSPPPVQQTQYYNEGTYVNDMYYVESNNNFPYYVDDGEDYNNVFNYSNQNFGFDTSEANCSFQSKSHYSHNPLVHYNINSM